MSTKESKFDASKTLIAAAFKIEEIPFCIAAQDGSSIYEIARHLGIPWDEVDSAKFKTVKVEEV